MYNLIIQLNLYKNNITDPDRVAVIIPAIFRGGAKNISERVFNPTGVRAILINSSLNFKEAAIKTVRPGR